MKKGRRNKAERTIITVQKVTHVFLFSTGCEDIASSYFATQYGTSQQQELYTIQFMKVKQNFMYYFIHITVLSLFVL